MRKLDNTAEQEVAANLSAKEKAEAIEARRQQAEQEKALTPEAKFRQAKAYDNALAAYKASWNPFASQPVKPNWYDAYKAEEAAKAERAVKIKVATYEDKRVDGAAYEKTDAKAEIDAAMALTQSTFDTRRAKIAGGAGKTEQSAKEIAQQAQADAEAKLAAEQQQRFADAQEKIAAAKKSVIVSGSNAPKQQNPIERALAKPEAKGTWADVARRAHEKSQGQSI